MKEYIYRFLFFIIALTFGWWWYYTYTNVPTATLIFKKNGVEERYTIAYQYTTLIIRNEEDSAYIFYDKNGESLIIIDDVDWSNVTIIKD